MTAFEERKAAFDAKLATLDEESNEAIERARKALHVLTDERAAMRVALELDHKNELAAVERDLAQEVRSQLNALLVAYVTEPSRAGAVAISDAWRDASEQARAQLGWKDLPSTVLLEETALALSQVTGLLFDRLPPCAEGMYGSLGASGAAQAAACVLSVDPPNPPRAASALQELEGLLRDAVTNSSGNKEWPLAELRSTLRSKVPYWSPRAHPAAASRPAKAVNERVAPPPPTVNGLAGLMPAAVAARLGV
jgi:hypothetical protein